MEPGEDPAADRFTTALCDAVLSLRVETLQLAAAYQGLMPKLDFLHDSAKEYANPNSDGDRSPRSPFSPSAVSSYMPDLKLQALPPHTNGRADARSPRLGSDIMETPAVLKVRRAGSKRLMYSVSSNLQDKSPGSPSQRKSGCSVGKRLSGQHNNNKWLPKPSLDKRWQELYVATDTGSVEQACRERRLDMFRKMDRSSRNNLIAESPVAKMMRCFGGMFKLINPHATWRICWDFLCMMWVLYDAITIPVGAGWNQDFSEGTIMYTVTILNVSHWTIDIFLCFRTGFFRANGSLVTSDWEVAKNYLCSWFVPDVGLVSLDMFILLSQSAATSDISLVRSVRSLRTLRILRVMRLVKIGKLKGAMEDVMTTNTLVITHIFVSLCGIYLLMHFLSCIWYFMGRLEAEAGSASWLDLVTGWNEEALMSSYSRSCYWVLGHLTAAPVDATITPQSLIERMFTCLMVAASLIILSTSVTKLSNAVQEMSRRNVNRDNARREIKRYLLAHDTPQELSCRVVKLALVAQSRRECLELDNKFRSLIPDTLMKELCMVQCGQYLHAHPLFGFIHDEHGEVMAELAKMLKSVVCSENDMIFAKGTPSTVMYVTSKGQYRLDRTTIDTEVAEDVKIPPVIYKECSYLSEIALWASSVSHTCTLRALTWAEILSLSGSDFRHSIRQSPICIMISYKYALAYLAQISAGTEGEQGEANVVDDAMPAHLSMDAWLLAQQVEDKKTVERHPPKARVRFEDILTSVLAGTELVLPEDVPEHASSSRMQRLVAGLTLAFPELDATDGTYAQLGERAERNRVLASLVSVLCLLGNSHSDFASAQPEASRLSEKLWNKWQMFVASVDTSLEMIRALMVFLVIRALGKVKDLQADAAIASYSRGPEDVVLWLMDAKSWCIPSVECLSDDMLNLVKATFHIYSQFNLAQMLQGENTPAQIVSLKDAIMFEFENEAIDPSVLLKFYLFALVGFMSGLRGAESQHGSLFLNDVNGQNLFRCIHGLQQLEKAPPQAIYWSYIVSRAQMLNIPSEEASDLALARLACLTRATSNDKEELLHAWQALPPSDKAVLTDQLLADGISEPTLVFEFLPALFANCRNNPVVGLGPALTLYVELVILVTQELNKQLAEDVLVRVNLSDIAFFADKVMNFHVFEAVGSNVRLQHQDMFKHDLVINSKHWHFVDSEQWEHEPTQHMTQTLKRMERKTACIASALYSKGPANTVESLGLTRPREKRLSHRVVPPEPIPRYFL